MKIQYLIAHEAHFDEMARLMAILFVQDGNAAPDHRTQVRALECLSLDSRYGRAVCAVGGDRVIAVATLHYMISTAIGELICRVEDVVVDTTYRNRGIGEGLMRFVMNQAKADSCARMLLDVKTPNSGARQFYQRLGFVVEDEIVMTRAL